MPAASHTWDVIAPPLTVITNTTPLGAVPAGDISTSATGELSFFDQPGSTYECRLDPIDDGHAAVGGLRVALRVRPVQRDARLRGPRPDACRSTGRPCSRDPPAEYEWTIDAADTIDPETIIQLGPADGDARARPRPSSSRGTDNLTAPIDLTFECSLDGAAFAACESGIVYTGLAVDAHTFEVRAIDNAPIAERRPSRRRPTRGRSPRPARPTRRRARTSRSPSVAPR